MVTPAPVINWNGAISAAVGVAATLFVAAYLLGLHIPFIASDRAAMFALAALGFLMCCIGMGQVATGLGWTHPITIAGMVLGVALIGMVIATAAGWRLPFIESDRAALLAIAGMGLVKWGLAIISRVFLHV